MTDIATILDQALDPQARLRILNARLTAWAEDRYGNQLNLANALAENNAQDAQQAAANIAVIESRSQTLVDEVAALSDDTGDTVAPTVKATVDAAPMIAAYEQQLADAAAPADTVADAPVKAAE